MEPKMIILQLTEAELKEAITKAVQVALASQKPSITDELLSRRDAANYLKITLPTLLTWEKKGYIQATRLGARVYFKKSSLLKPHS